MTTEYRVTVEKIERDEDGDPRGSVVLELLAPGAMLTRFAPGAVAEALGAERAAVTVVVDDDRMTPGGWGTAEAPAAGNDQPVDEPAEAPATDDKPKRKRRTKAEIEADNAAKAAAAAAGTPAPVEPAGVAVSTTSEGAAPVPPAVATPAPVEQPAAAPTEPAAPYNPFA